MTDISSGIRDKLTGSLNIESSLLSDFKQKTTTTKNREFSRQHVFDMLSDVTRLLMATHKDLTVAAAQANS